MKFRTEIAIEKPQWQIEPHHRLLLVGSCFAAEIGRRFADNQFRATVNPFGTMYNPVSILHTLQQLLQKPADGTLPPAFDVCFLTLGTNHVYRLRETGEIVDNCAKRPQRLFQEEELSVGECAGALRECIELLRQANPEVRIAFTVSPIRYAKYGFHGSQLSKATLLLAIHELMAHPHPTLPSSQLRQAPLYYFPAYEILNDELRDYRFYAADMLHPSEQAVDYVWQQLVASAFSPAARQMLADWQPIQQALGHQPFNPESAEYQQFRASALQKQKAFRAKYLNHNQ